MRLFQLIGLILLVNLFFVQYVFAADTGTVSATVTVQSVAVTVTDGSVSYGTLSLSSTKDTTVSGLSDTQTASNSGNVAEDFNISSTNATGGTAWTISNTAIGTDQYIHNFSTDSGSSWTPMTTGYAALTTNVSAAGTQTFDLKIETPSATTDYTQKSITVTVQAVAH